MVRVRRPLYNFTPHVISPQRLTLETSNFVHGSDMWSLSLVMSGRAQGHMSNFYIVDLESKSSVYRWVISYPQHVRGRFVYDTYRAMEATRSRHSWVQMFITHRPTVTLYLHNFDLFRTCRTSSFCGATENARPENAGLENDGQHFSKLWAKLRGLENAGLKNVGQNFSKLWAKLRGLVNAGLENDGPC